MKSERYGVEAEAGARGNWKYGAGQSHENGGRKTVDDSDCVSVRKTR